MTEQVETQPDEAMRQGIGAPESRKWIVDTVQSILEEWVDTAYRTAMAGYEGAPQQAAREMRWLHLAEPYVPACQIADALLLSRLGRISGAPTMPPPTRKRGGRECAARG